MNVKNFFKNRKNLTVLKYLSVAGAVVSFLLALLFAYEYGVNVASFFIILVAVFSRMVRKLNEKLK